MVFFSVQTHPKEILVDYHSASYHSAIILLAIILLLGDENWTDNHQTD